MQCDVNVREEAELRRLENGSQVGGDVMLRGDAAEKKRFALRCRLCWAGGWRRWRRSGAQRLLRRGASASVCS